MSQTNLQRGKPQGTRLPVTPSGTTTITLVRDQIKASYIDIQTGATGGWVLQFPVTPIDAGMWWLIRNASGQTVTVKGYTADGGTTPTTGEGVANAKISLVIWDGSEMVEFTGP
jgi:hypothetical protein